MNPRLTHAAILAAANSSLLVPQPLLNHGPVICKPHLAAGLRSKAFLQESERKAAGNAQHMPAEASQCSCRRPGLKSANLDHNPPRWAWEDLNFRPRPYQGRALAT